DFARQPFVLAWELTRACNLACVHCRAEAQLRRHPLELTTEEARRFIDDVARFDVPPVLILTGGDPMRRPDLIDLIAHATERGVRTTLTPAGTPLASPRRLAAARDAGLSRVAVSLDGPDAETHDRFRRVPGSFEWTLAIVRSARALRLPVQIHTTLSRQTIAYLPRMADLAEQLGAVVWAVFCLVPTGRAQFVDELTAEEYERTFAWLVERSATATWNLKLTEGYHFRRVLAQRRAGPVAGLGFQSADGIGRAPRAVNAGNGFCFVSHVGEVYPSGFLPLPVGNVRAHSIVSLYREHPLFRALRDPDRLKGKCGRCPFKRICGGSRSRAFAHTGDYLAADPACAYDPPGSLPAA
ncbi:MAG: TIGR04053 family radical SAM/SPASM domain-containing protein, partial [Thermomicrobiaceae bacterium]|nr:TIGR04053 family radical SAM/SPASM domain-containing protein [Thermomicrobiaceae bacterium]